MSQILKIDLAGALATKRPRVGNTLFIAVDGHGGSGKSTFAQLLAQKLHAEVVRTDDFASWDNPLDWWPLVIERVFEPVRNGARTLDYPRARLREDRDPDPVVAQPVTDVMIMEGVSALREEFRDYISLGFFVDTSRETCLRRAIKRDTGKTEEAPQALDEWFEEEDVHMARDNPKAYADFVIDGSKPFGDQI